MNRILIVVIAIAAAIAAGFFMFTGDNGIGPTPPVAVSTPDEASNSANAPEAVSAPGASNAAPVPSNPASGDAAPETAEGTATAKTTAAADSNTNAAAAMADKSTTAMANAADRDAAEQEMQTARNQPQSAVSRAAKAVREAVEEETADSKTAATADQPTARIADANPVASDGEKTREAIEDKVATRLDRIQDSAAAAADQVTKTEPVPVAPKRAPRTNQQDVAVIPMRAVKPPSFDVVRISDVDCTAVIAGQAPSRAIVRVSANGLNIATLRADGDGSWAHVTTKPFAPGGVELTLTAETAAGMADAPESVVLVVPDCADLSQDGKAIALLTPKNRTGTRILQAPETPDRIAMPQGLNLAKVDYDDQGKLEMSGSGAPDAELRAYVDGVYAGRTRADAGGEWRIVPDAEIAPGVHVLRVDHVDGAGTVLARIELPFVRATPEAVRITVDQVVVQPGNSLWRIARRTYGRGISYTTIYQANQDRIRDPDLIYPGQVFNLPDLPDTRNN